MLIQAVKIRVKFLGYLAAASAVALLGYTLYTVMRDSRPLMKVISIPSARSNSCSSIRP